MSNAADDEYLIMRLLTIISANKLMYANSFISFQFPQHKTSDKIDRNVAGSAVHSSLSAAERFYDDIIELSARVVAFEQLSALCVDFHEEKALGVRV